MGTEELKLHELVMAKDDLALAKLYDIHCEYIITHLKIKYSDIAKRDSAYLFQAVNEAFFGYYNNPSTFNIDKGSLRNFLKVAADRDLINILQKENKHINKVNLPEEVEHEESFWNSIVKNSESADDKIISEETLKLIDKELANHFSSDKDIMFVKMMLQGVRETESFVEILQLNNLEIDKQRAEVKRSKDRITKVMERNQLVLKLKNILQ